MSQLRRRRFVQLAGTATATGVLVSCGRRDGPWRFLTAAEGRTLEALCEQIVPTDQTPGAAWAGVVNYIDRQLMGPFRRQRDTYRGGLAALDQAAIQFAGAPFASLEPARQQALLSGLQGDLRRFFGVVIGHTMQGYYGDPRHGGNREAVSWQDAGVPVPRARTREVTEHAI